MFSILKRKSSRRESQQTEQSFFGPNLSFGAKEAYKLLRTNLLFSLPESEEDRGYVIGITSSLRGEGKSTTTINLASTLAEQNVRVLVIDGDLRLPSVHKKLKIHAKPGLSNILVSREPSEQFIQRMEVERVGGHPIVFDVLAAGAVPPNPSELIGSNRMKRRLEQLSEKYDFILLDLPPVTAVTDALVATKLGDGVILVVRNEYADTGSLQEAIRQLRLVDAKILGFVYACASGSLGGYGYKKKYKYRYYSHYSDAR